MYFSPNSYAIKSDIDLGNFPGLKAFNIHILYI